MKTRYNNIISRSAKAACMGLALLCTSCLDFAPEAQMNDESVWSEANNFQLFANQFYGWTSDLQAGETTNYRARVNDGPHSDFRSDIMTGPNVNVYSAGTNSIPSEDGNYNNLYKQIYYTNLLLKNAEGFGRQDEIRCRWPRPSSSVPTAISSLCSSTVTAYCLPSLPTWTARP